MAKKTTREVETPKVKKISHSTAAAYAIRGMTGEGEFIRPMLGQARSCKFVRPIVLSPHRYRADVEWYNDSWPHTWLGGKTLNEAYYGKFPATRCPSSEGSSHEVARSSPCAQPWDLVRGSPGGKVTLQVDFHQDYKHLPFVKLKRVA